MARITCGISNVSYTCDHVPMVVNNREVTHPIFHLTQKRLLGLYSVYIKGQLTETDSYLLFLALLNSTDSIEWVVPTIETSSTQSIIANNLAELVSVIWATNAIQHPRFKQPKFFVRNDTANLDNIKIWIAAWRKNIEDFKLGIESANEMQLLTRTENKLSNLILSPDKENSPSLVAAVADWADRAASFPVSKKEGWKLIIRKCYNLDAMFSTPREDIIALKEYCEENLEAGSIHFHTLMKTLRAGISNHNDFLGLGSLGSTSDAGYTLLTTDNSKEEAALLSIASVAPTSEPIQADYPNKLAFIKARLAYKQAQKLNLMLNYDHTTTGANNV